MSEPPYTNIDELLHRLLDNQIESDEMERLQEAMLKDRQVQDYYIDTIFTCAVMRRCSQDAAELSEFDLIRVLSGGENRGGFQRTVRHFRSVAAVLVLGVLTCVACFGLFHHRDRGPAIGTLSEASEAQWRGSHPQAGEPLYAGRYDLREGTAKMELGQGASVLLEAPCLVELTSAGGLTLRTGRLAASVPAQAKGFRVRTPSAVITDLGTEFGVFAHPDGSAETHVLKGRVNVALDPNKSGRSASLIVNEHQAAAVDAAGKTIQSGLIAREDLFVLEQPSTRSSAGSVGRLNLADIVGGGNGHGTGTLDRGIEILNGQAFRYPPTEVLFRPRYREFRPSSFRGVDGVFLPNGALGPVVISSTGLTCAEFPRTVGSYFGGPANSGKFLDLSARQVYTARLNGITFGTATHPALCLHPNAGITFDLNLIREDNPGMQIDRFSAVCGMPKDLPQPRFSSADAWILLDGVVRLHLNCPTEKAFVKDVDIPIPPEARFLTLATTCSGLADFSWILFGDPFLEAAIAAQ
jgi:hypothetical protein